MKGAPPVGSFATSWLHFLALCQRTGSYGVKEKEEQREKDRGWTGKETDERGFCSSCCESERDLSEKKDVSSSTPSWLFNTHPPTQAYRVHTHHRTQVLVALWGNCPFNESHVPMAHTPSISTLSLPQHLPSPSDLCPFPSIIPSHAFNTTSIHHSSLSSLSTHPFFCLYLSVHPSAGTVVMFWQGHGHRLVHTSLLSAAALKSSMIWFLVLSLLDTTHKVQQKKLELQLLVISILFLYCDYVVYTFSENSKTFPQVCIHFIWLAVQKPYILYL